VLFLDGGRIEIDTNVVERAIRPVAFNRKNALFAGSDQGGILGVIASLIEICKPQRGRSPDLCRRRPQALVNRHPASQIGQLMPWAYAKCSGLKTALMRRLRRASHQVRT
jgi:transposase